MKYSHIFTLSTGESSSKEVTPKFSDTNFVKDTQQVALKDFGDAKNLKFCRLPKSWEGGWHNSPVKQFVIGVSGSIKMTCSDYSYVTLSAGDVVILEDLTGKGHHTEVISTEDWHGVLVEL